ncbi:MAG: TIGR03960 family B12-binding radical SAM protein [Deltaproteobacteria bacterium]|nr:TIGR03960 family B12-binding radical SAM protein [Deltaproteobacteria bacterium]
MPGYSKESFKTALEDIFPHVTRPSRYLGNEINSVRKNLDEISTKFLLAFPDVYEVGMSHVGFQILYHLLNSQDDVAAERVFTPWIDMERLLREKKIPLLSLESRYPLYCFDIIGFSLQYELSYTNVLTMLDLGNIPLRSCQRDGQWPLIIAGGPCTFNPEPVADFFDAFAIGEGEEVVIEITRVFTEWKSTGKSRPELLEILTTVPGVYVPAKFEVSYFPQGPIREVKPLQSGYTTVTKRVVPDLDVSPYPTKFIVPFTQIVHDRFNLEIARGCTRGCRFCQAGMIYRPGRERSCSLLEHMAAHSLELTGWEEMSLLSLSSGDYTEIENLLRRLMTRYSPHHVTISLPSLRAETLSRPLLTAIEGGRKTGFTIAPEAGTERLRKVINKKLREVDILETCRQVFSSGWRNIKLYFMIGLPTETKTDLEGILTLAEEAWLQGKGYQNKRNVTVSVSTFIPKPHTPFQWEAMIPSEEILFRQRFLRSRLRRGKFTFKWQDPHASVLEGIIARGDRRLADVIEDAFAHGCRFDGWSECFSYEAWEQALHKCGLSPSLFLGQKEPSEILPWDHVNSGVTKDYLRKELAASREEAETEGCGPTVCNNCGVCDFSVVRPRVSAVESVNDPTTPRKQEPLTTDTVIKVRLRFSKAKEARFLSHLEMINVFSRAARRARLPVQYSKGYHPHPKIVFGPPLPVGFESVAEYADIEFTEDISPDFVRDSLNHHLPHGISVFTGVKIPLKSKAISDSLDGVRYSIPFGDLLKVKAWSPDDVKKVINDFLGAATFTITRPRKGKSMTVDIRSLVEHLGFSEQKAVEVTLRVSETLSVRPTDILAGVFGLAEREVKNIPVLKTEMKLGETWDPI